VTGLSLVSTKAAESGSGDIVEIDAYDTSGKELGTTVLFPARNQKLVFVLRDKIPAVAGNVGSLQITSVFGSYAALGLRFNGRAFTSVPVF
jgi:hypothetical protein